MRCRGRFARGFSLVEVMVALGLGALLAAGALSVTRSQLNAMQLNDHTARAEESARSGSSFVEQSIRKVCPGTTTGQVFVNLSGVAQTTRSCLRWFDGAQQSLGTFTTGSAGQEATGADAVEAIVQQGPAQIVTGASVAGPWVDVTTTAGFAAGDYVLVSNYDTAHLLAVASVTATRITFTSPGAAVTPTVAPGFTWAAGNIAVRVQAISYYVQATTTGGVTEYNLMLDQDIFTAGHSDAQFVAEGVEDFQVALGVDANADGVVTESSASPGTDEWIGNTTGEAAPAVPWSLDGGLQPRQVRITLLARTALRYAGNPPTIGPIEDRATSSYLPITDTTTPRYRPMFILIAPRSWNLNQ